LDCQAILVKYHCKQVVFHNEAIYNEYLETASSGEDYQFRNDTIQIMDLVYRNKVLNRKE
jgi:hypothetical protein